MGFPSAGAEAMYRNPLQQVQRFFHERHPNAFRLYNLCSERECVLRRGWCAAFAHVCVCVYVLLLLMAAVVTDALLLRRYDPADFHGRVRRFPFDDHNPCPLAMIPRFCKDIDDFLAENEKNVVAVHCKAGKVGGLPMSPRRSPSSAQLLPCCCAYAARAARVCLCLPICCTLACVPTPKALSTTSPVPARTTCRASPSLAKCGTATTMRRCCGRVRGQHPSTRSHISVLTPYPRLERRVRASRSSRSRSRAERRSTTTGSTPRSSGGAARNAPV